MCDGLEFRDFKSFNTPFTRKNWWRIFLIPYSLISSFLKVVYFPHTDGHKVRILEDNWIPKGSSFIPRNMEVTRNDPLMVFDLICELTGD